MTPAKMKEWLQGVLDYKTVEGTPMTVDDLRSIRNAINRVIDDSERRGGGSGGGGLPFPDFSDYHKSIYENPMGRGIMSCSAPIPGEHTFFMDARPVPFLFHAGAS